LPLIFRLHRLFFGVSALTFRCKPPLGASSPSISAESTFIFRCKLCIPLGTTFELLLVFFSFLFALDGALSDFTFTSLGDIALIELKIRKREITCYGPIKNLSPPLERKRVP
jgi:hypothetical protein